MRIAFFKWYFFQRNNYGKLLITYMFCILSMIINNKKTIPFIPKNHTLFLELFSLVGICAYKLPIHYNSN